MLGLAGAFGLALLSVLMGVPWAVVLVMLIQALCGLVAWLLRE